MKKIITNLASITCVLFLFVNSVPAQKSDREIQGFSGPVKAVRYESAKFNIEGDIFSELEKNLDSFYLFNESGKEIGFVKYTKTIAFLTECYFVDKASYTRDEKGKIIEQTINRVGYAPINHLPVDTMIKDPDPKEGKKFASFRTPFSKVLDQTGLIGKDIFSYDDYGRMSSRSNYNKNGNLVYKHVLKYKGSSHLIHSLSVFRSDGSLSEEQFNLNSKNNILSSGFLYSGQGDNITKTPLSSEHELDDYGNWTKKIISKKVSKFGKDYFEPIIAIYAHYAYFE